MGHDVILTPGATGSNGTAINCSCGSTNPECLNIQVPPYDKYYSNRGVTCFPFVRAAAAVSSMPSCQFSAREQFTETTHAFDLSSLYGWDDVTADKVRSGYKGMLAWTKVPFRRSTRCEEFRAFKTK